MAGKTRGPKCDPFIIGRIEQTVALCTFQRYRRFKVLLEKPELERLLKEIQGNDVEVTRDTLLDGKAVFVFRSGDGQDCMVTIGVVLKGLSAWDNVKNQFNMAIFPDEPSPSGF